MKTLIIILSFFVHLEYCFTITGFNPEQVKLNQLKVKDYHPKLHQDYPLKPNGSEKDQNMMGLNYLNKFEEKNLQNLMFSQQEGLAGFFVKKSFLQDKIFQLQNKLEQHKKLQKDQTFKNNPKRKRFLQNQQKIETKDEQENTENIIGQNTTTSECDLPNCQKCSEQELSDHPSTPNIQTPTFPTLPTLPILPGLPPIPGPFSPGTLTPSQTQLCLICKEGYQVYNFSKKPKKSNSKNLNQCVLNSSSLIEFKVTMNSVEPQKFQQRKQKFKKWISSLSIENFEENITATDQQGIKHTNSSTGSISFSSQDVKIVETYQGSLVVEAWIEINNSSNLKAVNELCSRLIDSIHNEKNIDIFYSFALVISVEAQVVQVGVSNSQKKEQNKGSNSEQNSNQADGEQIKEQNKGSNSEQHFNQADDEQNQAKDQGQLQGQQEQNINEQKPKNLSTPVTQNNILKWLLPVAITITSAGIKRRRRKNEQKEQNMNENQNDSQKQNGNPSRQNNGTEESIIQGQNKYNKGTKAHSQAPHGICNDKSSIRSSMGATQQQTNSSRNSNQIKSSKFPNNPQQLYQSQQSSKPIYSKVLEMIQDITAKV